MAKRRGEHAAAAAMWEVLLEDAECRLAACEELAAHHERRTKNFSKALEYAHEALKELRGKNSRSKYATTTIGQQRRIERLTKRVARLEARRDGMANRDTAPLLRRHRASVAGE